MRAARLARVAASAAPSMVTHTEPASTCRRHVRPPRGRRLDERAGQFTRPFEVAILVGWRADPLPHRGTPAHRQLLISALIGSSSCCDGGPTAAASLRGATRRRLGGPLRETDEGQVQPCAHGHR